MKELYHIFAYLKKHHNAEMVFDPTPFDLDSSQFGQQDFSYSTYGHEDTKQVLPKGMLTPYGPGFTIRVFVDSDHAGNLATQRSRTGFVVFLNGAPIY